MKILKTYIPALVLTLFGLLTLYLSSSIIFDLFDMRAKQGDYVMFVIWANFICSLIYLTAALGFIKQKKWTTYILGVSLLILIFTFFKFNAYIEAGGVYMVKTVGALKFRMAVTIFFTLIGYLTLNKKKVSA